MDTPKSLRNQILSWKGKADPHREESHSPAPAPPAAVGFPGRESLCGANCQQALPEALTPARTQGKDCEGGLGADCAAATLQSRRTPGMEKQQISGRFAGVWD